jgi:amidase
VRPLLNQNPCQTYIARIKEVNSNVHAVSQVNPRALEIAEERDRERARGDTRGILHGIPILVKDVFCTTDGMNTTGEKLNSCAMPTT